ncbi:MAG: type II secretion system F family protein [Methanosarcinales archaeon]|nr:type II secretion system F family protein [Methanosarcinales archaeon]
MFCYHFGRYIDRTPRDGVAKMLYQADIEMTPGMFISLAGVTAVISTGMMLFSSTILFRGDIVYVLGLSVFTFALTLGGFPFVLYNKISAKKMNIEQELPYMLGYMSVLASAGTSPIDVVRRISIEDYGHISKEFGKVIYRVDILGEDAVTAMSDLIQNTPSEMFRVICIDLANIIHSGSGFRDYLEIKSRDLMTMRRLVQKEFVDSLSVYGEGYLGGIVMCVVLAVLGIVVCGALGIDMGVFAPRDLFNVFVYFVLPFVNILFLAMLSMKYSGSPV